MQVKKLVPQGYCQGVILALKKCLAAIENPEIKKPIYLLGMLIHNKNVCQALQNKGIIILNGKSRLEMLDQISQGTVIISAHGVEESVYEKARKKEIDIIDTTCPIVKKVHEKIKQHLNNQEKILYIGNQNHPEAQGVINESKQIILIDKDSDLDILSKNDCYYLTTQTTLSALEIMPLCQAIKEKIPQAIIDTNICDATTKRQQALIGQETDLLIIVGDKKSSNTTKLKEVAEKKASFEKLLAIESLNELNGIDLVSYKKAIVTSGASTPKAITNEIIDYLESYPNKKAISILTDDDYLQI